MLLLRACRLRCTPLTRNMASPGRCAHTLSGEGSCAIVFGGFGFTERALRRHEMLYEEHGFKVLPVLSTIPQLVTPKIGWERGPALAAQVQEADAPIVIHTVSGSFWTAIFMLAHLDPDWREHNVRAIMFDSCPPKSDVNAFGGWLSWMLQAKTGVPARHIKPLVRHLFHPALPYFGIDSTWRAQNDAWMFGDEARGQDARTLHPRAGANVADCQALAEAAASRALAEAGGSGDDDGCVVPSSAACLFVRGRNDPVLEPQYIDAFYAHLKARTRASVEWHLFEKAQHAMAVVETPEDYKRQHVERLLRQVPEWQQS
mmetsp:Transcript_61964/g.184432  ORF Transcript_61964/g.184432 Transcript_61964/m.184432 type:complete len:316 (-) Transcript_61964:182-1129(-)